MERVAIIDGLLNFLENETRMNEVEKKSIYIQNIHHKNRTNKTDEWKDELQDE